MTRETGVPVTFVLNGKNVEPRFPAGRTLREALRKDFALTASMEGCGKEECGACIAQFNEKPLNSCPKVVSTSSLLMTIPRPAEEQTKEALSGNIRRCIGYTKSINAVDKAVG